MFNRSAHHCFGNHGKEYYLASTSVEPELGERKNSTDHYFSLIFSELPSGRPSSANSGETAPSFPTEKCTRAFYFNFKIP
jgi:hypothetical protein